MKNEKNNSINKFYSNWGIQEINFIKEPYEISIVGKNFKSIRKKFDTNYLPNVIFLGGKNEGALSLLENKL